MTDAEINFAPICSKCGHIIFDEINFVEEELFGQLDKTSNKYVAPYRIDPYKCPHCGSYFKTISTPLKLPYTYDNLELKKKVMAEHHKENNSYTCTGCSYDDGAFHNLCTVCTRSSSDGIDDYYEPNKENQNEDT